MGIFLPTVCKNVAVCSHKRITCGPHVTEPTMRRPHLTKTMGSPNALRSAPCITFGWLQRAGGDLSTGALKWSSASSEQVIGRFPLERKCRGLAMKHTTDVVTKPEECRNDSYECKDHLPLFGVHDLVEQRHRNRPSPGAATRTGAVVASRWTTGRPSGNGS